jgi:hypothetical protein
MVFFLRLLSRTITPNRKTHYAAVPALYARFHSLLKATRITKLEDVQSVRDGGRVGRPGHEMVPEVLERWERSPLHAP